MFCLPSTAQPEQSETEDAKDGYSLPEFKQSKRYLADSISTGPILASYLEPPYLPGNMMMYLNQASSAGPYSEFLSRSSLFPHERVEIPPVGGRNEVVYIPPTGDTISVQSISEPLNTATSDPIGNSVTDDPRTVPRTQLGILDGEQNLQCQGLSLSLNTQMPSAVPVPSSQYQYSNAGLSSFASHHLPISVERTVSWKGYENSQGEELRNAECLPSGFPGGNHNGVKAEAFCNPQYSVNPKEIHSDSFLSEPFRHANNICNSKYLKAAQQLLDEVVNVRMALKRQVLEKHQNFPGNGPNVSKETDGRSSSHSMLSSVNGMSSVLNDANSSCELSPAERQDRQNKKTKLLSMLDEVDRKYQQYYHQMRILISLFDMVVGSGASKPYTALAFQTISRHFRCLRDAVSGQIQVTRRSLGEQDTSSNVQGGIRRLRYVDQQLRQHRALEQLGVMRHAWRPQRGLPESSVSILRAWLFEHFLHPYPKDSEKILLARQTGLTRSQVANWFINARVRLWKPMVEDMYKEEFGDLEIDSNSSQDNAPKALKDNSWASEERGDELQESLMTTVAGSGSLGQFHDLKSDFIPNVELNGPTTRVDFQNGAHGDDDMDCGVKKLKSNKRPNVDDCSLYPDEFIPANQNGDGSPMAAPTTYPIPELGDFAVDGQVSLALGLRHCESDVLTMCGGTHISRDDGAASSMGSDAMDYHCMDSGNQRHRFGNPHLLHDFVV